VAEVGSRLRPKSHWSSLTFSLTRRQPKRLENPRLIAAMGSSAKFMAEEVKEKKDKRQKKYNPDKKKKVRPAKRKGKGVQG